MFRGFSISVTYCFWKNTRKTLIETFDFEQNKTTVNIEIYANLAFIRWNPIENVRLILPHIKPKDTHTEKATPPKIKKILTHNKPRLE